MGIFDKLFKKKEKKLDASLLEENKILLEVPKIDLNNLDNLFPRIKAVHNLNKKGKAINLPKNQEPYLIPFAEDLMLGFAFDTGSNYVYLKKEDREKLSQDDEQLIALSLKNVIKEVGDNISFQSVGEHIIMPTIGGNHENILVLFNSIWEDIETNLGKDNIAIALPTKDILFVFPRDNQSALKQVKLICRGMHNKSSTKGLQSTNIYHRFNNKWLKIDAF